MKSPGKGRRQHTEEHGAAAVEFAIVASLLFMLVFGIIEYGRIFNQLEVFTSAAREGARVAAVRGTADEIEDAVNKASSPYLPDETPVADKVCTDSTSGQSVTVSWTQHFEISIGILPPLNKDVEVKGTFRCE